MTAYVVGFILLFVISGIGNGSVYKMIPAIFAAKAAARHPHDAPTAAVWSRTMSGALIGIAGAVGALGGVAINLVLRASYLGVHKSATTAFWVFAAFYIICAAITWTVYLRRPTTSTPSPAGTLTPAA